MRVNLLESMPQSSYDTIAEDVDNGKSAVLQYEFDGYWCSPVISTLNAEYHWKLWARVNQTILPSLLRDPEFIKVSAVGEQHLSTTFQTTLVGSLLAGAATLWFVKSPKIAGVAALLGAAAGATIESLYSVDDLEIVLRRNRVLHEQVPISILSPFTYVLPKSGELHYAPGSDPWFINVDVFLSALQHVLMRKGVIVMHKMDPYLDIVRKGPSILSLPTFYQLRDLRIVLMEVNDMLDKACATVLWKYGYVVMDKAGRIYKPAKLVQSGSIVIEEWDRVYTKAVLYNVLSTVQSLDNELDKEVQLDGKGKIPITEYRLLK